jgi:hypothetical protein
MGNGLQPVGGSSPRITDPGVQESIQESSKVSESKPKEVKEEKQPAGQANVRSSDSNPSAQRFEQSLNGMARRAELEGHFERNIERGESMKAARKILDNAKLSNQAKISELQKMLGKSGGLEFEQFMKQMGNFSSPQQQIVNSAITESPKILERIAEDLPPGLQLDVVSNAVMNPLKGKTESEEKERVKRADRGIAEWIQSTDVSTLDTALSGKAVSFQASAKLFGVLASDPALLIRNMGPQSRLMGDNLAIANDLMNIVHGPASFRNAPMTRSEIEAAAAGMIVRYAQIEADMRRVR